MSIKKYLLFLSVLVDFNLENPTIVFPPAASSQAKCTAVTILGDAILEKEETFCLNLNSSDPNVLIGLSPVMSCIMIADNNSEFELLYIVY